MNWKNLAVTLGLLCAACSAKQTGTFALRRRGRHAAD
jgi:hypothetical protein